MYTYLIKKVGYASFYLLVFIFTYKVIYVMQLTDSTGSTANLTETAPGVELLMDGTMEINNARVSMVGGGKLSSYHYPKVEGAGWQTSESFSLGSSLNVQNSYDRSPLNSTISEDGIRRSRPSFLDSLNISRISSVSHLPFTESDKSEHFMPSRSSKVQNEEIFASSTSHPSFAEPDTLEPLFKFRNILNADMHSASPSVSINNDEIPRLNVQDDSIQKKHDFPSMEKDDDFAALEQVHIFSFLIYAYVMVLFLFDNFIKKRIYNIKRYNVQVKKQ